VPGAERRLLSNNMTWVFRWLLPVLYGTLAVFAWFAASHRAAAVVFVFAAARSSGEGEDLTVFARYGRMDMTLARVDACLGQPGDFPPRDLIFIPPTKSYRIDFLFDGHDYKVAPSTAAAAKIFAEH
jgi:hypothetical protein